MKKEVIKLTVWITLFIILAITTFILTDDNKTNEKKIEQKELFKLKIGDIQKLKINTDDSKITARKENDKWIITKPKKYETERRNILDWTKQFSSIETDEEINTKSIIDFGIGPTQEPNFYAWDKNNKKYTITVGDKTPDEKKYYIKTNQNEKIFTVNTNLIEENGLDSSLKKLRSKDFLKIKKEDIKSISFDKLIFGKTNISIQKLKKLPENIKLNENITYETKTQILKYKGRMTKEEKEILEKLSEDKEYENAIKKLFNKANKTNWTITSIKNKEIDINKTSSFIKSLTNIKAYDFPQDTKIPFNEKESLSFRIASKNKTITLYISAYKDKVYAKIKNKDDVYEIQKHIFDRLNKNEKDFIIEEIKEKDEEKKEKK